MDESIENDIVGRHQAGQSMRSIARQLRVSRNTIADLLAKHETSRNGGCRKQRHGTRRIRPSKIRPFDARIKEILAKSPDIKIVRLLDQLRQEGFQGSYTILRERVKQIRESDEAKYISQTVAPGAVTDTEVRRYRLSLNGNTVFLAFLFCFRLAYSCRVYLHFAPACDLVTTMYEHARAFEHLGGVTLAVRYTQVDSVLVTGETEPVFKPTFLRFATHYGFRPIISDQSFTFDHHSIVERMERELLASGPYRSLDHLNEELRFWWRTTLDDHQDSAQQEMYAKDLAALIPLPRHPWDG